MRPRWTARAAGPPAPARLKSGPTHRSEGAAGTVVGGRIVRWVALVVAAERKRTRQARAGQSGASVRGCARPAPTRCSSSSKRCRRRPSRPPAGQRPSAGPPPPGGPPRSLGPMPNIRSPSSPDSLVERVCLAGRAGRAGSGAVSARESCRQPVTVAPAPLSIGRKAAGASISKKALPGTGGWRQCLLISHFGRRFNMWKYYLALVAALWLYLTTNFRSPW